MCESRRRVTDTLDRGLHVAGVIATFPETGKGRGLQGGTAGRGSSVAGGQIPLDSDGLGAGKNCEHLANSSN